MKTYSELTVSDLKSIIDYSSKQIIHYKNCYKIDKEKYFRKEDLIETKFYIEVWQDIHDTTKERLNKTIYKLFQITFENDN